MTINAPAAVLLLLYELVAERAGRRRRSSSRGTIQNDMLKEYIARGTYIFPPRPSHAADHRHLRLLRRATCRGGTRSRSAATTSARPARPPRRSWPSRWPTASPTSRRRVEAGLEVDEFAPRLSFFFNAHNNFLEEVAKFRAARRMWADDHARAFRRHAKSAAMMLRFHTQTGGSTLTAQQPHNNVVRTTIQALAAVLGGAPEPAHQRLRRGAGPADRGAPRWRCAPSRSSPTRAACTATADPLAGSYYVEALTDALEAGARELIEEIDAWAGRWQRDRGGLGAGSDRAVGVRPSPGGAVR